MFLLQPSCRASLVLRLAFQIAQHQGRRYCSGSFANSWSRTERNSRQVMSSLGLSNCIRAGFVPARFDEKPPAFVSWRHGKQPHAKSYSRTLVYGCSPPCERRSERRPGKRPRHRAGYATRGGTRSSPLGRDAVPTPQRLIPRCWVRKSASSWRSVKSLLACLAASERRWRSRVFCLLLMFSTHTVGSWIILYPYSPHRWPCAQQSALLSEPRPLGNGGSNRSLTVAARLIGAATVRERGSNRSLTVAARIKELSP